MKLVLESARRAGLCSLHCLEGYGDYRSNDFRMMLDLDSGQQVRLALYCRDKDPGLALEMGINRFGGCWCLDGAIGAHSAAISEPYADKPESRGELYFSDQQISDWLEEGLANQMQVCVHAIGERALEQAVGVLEQLAQKYDLHALRPRVDHFILGSSELAGRAAALGIASAMQPAFDARWGGESGGYANRLGAARALRTNPVGEMMAAGLKVAGSSDSYITPLDPIGGIHAAMNHHNPRQQVSYENSVSLFSEMPAYLCMEEGSRGRIAEGYAADFTVIDGDRSLNGATVSTTVIDGEICFEAEKHSLE